MTLQTETRRPKQSTPPHTDNGSRLPVIYCSPFDNETNAYLRNFRRNLECMGFEVKTPYEIWSFKSIVRNRLRPVLFLHWFEDQVLTRREKSKLLSWFVFSYKLLAAKLNRARIVWVRHNYQPHQRNVPLWVQRFVFAILSRASDQILVHSADAAKQSKCRYAPHPLYDVTWDDVSSPVVSSPISDRIADVSTRVAVVGQIRRSKGIVELLMNWPADVRLLIAGRFEDDEYEQEIRQLIASRALNVAIDCEPFSNEEFEAVLRHARALYVPNTDGTMIVSGVVIHAASVGSSVLIADSAFGREMARQTDFVAVCETPDQIKTSLSQLPDRNASVVRARAEALFGQAAFEAAMEEVLRPYLPADVSQKNTDIEPKAATLGCDAFQPTRN